MKKMTKLIALFLSGLLLAPALVSANPEGDQVPESGTVAAKPPVTAEAPAAAQPQTTWEKILANLPKVSGYLQTGWNYTSNDKSSSSSFQAKRLRLLLDGKVAEKVDFRLQIEAFNGISGSTNGNGQKNIQVMDAFATWKIMPEFKVRVGQFFTPLGYENYDISPATLETVDFSNIVYRIACRNPYEYNLVDYGRDLGIMFMGDVFDSGKGFSYLHYDVAITNGSIPSKDDSNKSKDIYVSLTVRPVKYFNVKGTFNWGEYTSKKLEGGEGVGSGDYNPMTRYVVGAWYDNPRGLNLRAEYGHMKSRVNKADVVIVAAGLDAALASVLGGLTSRPFIAVPTSVGYGVAQGGHAALSSMLSSCAPGLAVMNIDNGYGAACAAARILNAIYPSEN